MAQNGILQFADRLALIGILAGSALGGIGIMLPIAYPDFVSVHKARVCVILAVIILIISFIWLVIDVAIFLRGKGRLGWSFIVIFITGIAIWYFWPEDLFDTRLPGFGGYAVLRLYDSPDAKRKYVFSASTDQGAKAELYISAADRVTLDVTDIHGEHYSLEVPLGHNRIPLDQFIAVFAEVGIYGGNSALRLSIDGREIARRTLGFAIDLGSRKWKNTAIASDSAGKNAGSLLLVEMGMWDQTFSNEKLAGLFENAKQYFEIPSL